ncbi:serine hydrolase [Desulfovibrio sp. JC010]|uniref:serine hydrolase domain-containing protein n=1 Tax=Desulfovibrio sp. JC010 TaxID=2593641 RepID=UPI0013D5F21D|nr:serine hydrolase domain-containing protein [Desulfovibrio sp. JC010]NDV28842.1 beta-lactamase family protein [Desulfovibrio sp. JC010]
MKNHAVVYPCSLLLIFLLALCPVLFGNSGCGVSTDNNSTVNGAVVANPLLVNAVVSAVDADGRTFSFGRTAADGSFGFNYPQDAQFPLILNFSGGYFQGSNTEFKGTVRTGILNSNATEISASTVSTLAVEIAESIDMPGAALLDKLDRATQIVHGLLQDYGTFNVFTDLPCAMTDSTVLTSQRLRYANNSFVDILGNYVGARVNGTCDLASSDFNALLRSVALDLCDSSWDGVSNVGGDTAALNWLAASAAALGTGAAFKNNISSYVPSTTWASITNLMAGEQQSTSVPLTAAQPANPVPSPKIQPATAQFSSDFETALGTKFDEVVGGYNCVGGIIAILRPDGADTRYATGLSEAASITDMDQTTWTAGTNMGFADNLHWRIASVSKSFTSTMILTLVNDGILSLDQTINHWLGAVVPNSNVITIENLLRQTSGLYNREADPCEALVNNHTYSFAELAAMSNQAGGGKVYFQPGEQFKYADINYILLAWIAERATGLTYKQLIEQRVIIPAGLTNTSVPEPSDSSMPVPYIRGYSTCADPGICGVGDGCWKNFSIWNYSFDVGSGNVISTVADMLTWLKVLDSGSLVGDEMRARMVEKTPGVDDKYGLGVMYDHDSSGNLIKLGHDGENPGYSTYAFKSCGYYVVVMVNSDNSAELDSVQMPEVAGPFIYSEMNNWLNK